MRGRVLIITAGLILVLFGIWESAFGPAGSSDGPTVHFVVEEGASLRRVAHDLEQAGLVKNAFALRVWAQLRGQERSVRSGEYELRSGLRVGETLQALVAGPLLTRPVTLPEGWTRTQTVHGLAENLELEVAELDSLTEHAPVEWRLLLGLSETASLEGYLFPETYRFATGVSARTVLETLVFAFVAAIDDSVQFRATETGMTLHEVVTLASIVEAEAVLDRERPAIAAVYRNRIREGWKLEADPTVAYALDKIGERLTYRDLDVDSPYNTYRNPGLPPGPINSPGRASILAVLWPEPDSDAMYFVADGEGGHRFSRTWDEHQRAVREYRAIQRERRAGSGGGG